MMRTHPEPDALDSYAEAVKTGLKPQLNRQLFGNGERSSELLLHGWSSDVSFNVSQLNGVAQEAASMSAQTAHFHQRGACVNVLMESAQSNTSLRSVSKGLMSWARQ